MKTTLKGMPVTLEGQFPQKGDKAPGFTLIKNDLSQFSLETGKNNLLILNIFPSLDTGVCATSVRRFNRMAASLPGALVLCISKDLPFAQQRFCVTEGIDHVITLSDFQYSSNFGKDYGVLITDGPMKGLLARAVIVIDTEGKVIYSELVPEITQEPDYETALNAVK